MNTLNRLLEILYVAMYVDNSYSSLFLHWPYFWYSSMRWICWCRKSYYYPTYYHCVLKLSVIFTRFNTGCFFWKVKISNGCSSVMVHIWPNVGKNKMCLRGGRFFSIFENLFTFLSCLFTIFQNICHLSNLFWLYQHRVKYALLLKLPKYLFIFNTGIRYLSINTRINTGISRYWKKTRK